jgi:hypothetical protein
MLPSNKPPVIYAETFAQALASPGTPFRVDFNDEDVHLVIVRKMVSRNDNEIDAIQVLDVDGFKLSNGFHVPVTQLTDLAAREQEYITRIGGDAWAENNKAELFGYLLDLIENEGGHEAFYWKVEAEKIRTAMKMGELSNDIMNLFVPNKAGKVGIDTGEHVLVIESGYWRIGFGKKASDRFVFRLIEAPLGAPQGLFSVGTYVVAADLLNEQGNSRSWTSRRRSSALSRKRSVSFSRSSSTRLPTPKAP